MVLLAACGSPQRFADLGDCPVEGAQPIRGCRLGYRTFGTLSPARDNAVLLLPWYQGKSADLASHVGPDGIVDPRRHFVIAVDAFGNGVASSPSTSALQPGEAFPPFSLRDLVRAEHALVTRQLGLDRLEAVIGISMGGMQALAWATEHPGFARAVVAAVPSPRSTAADRRYWEATVSEVRRTGRVGRALSALRDLRPGAALFALRTHPQDQAAQARAIAGLDLTEPFGGSLEAAAAAVRSRLLVVVSARDEVVDPAPARAFAAAAGGELLVLDGRCGHAATRCERQALFAAARAFVDEGAGGGRQ
jgi:homoserine O-acetyltransferase